MIDWASSLRQRRPSFTFLLFSTAWADSRSIFYGTITTSGLEDVPASFLFFSNFLLRGATSSPTSSVALEGLSLLFFCCNHLLMHHSDDSSNRPIIRVSWSWGDSSRCLVIGTNPCGELSLFYGWSTTLSNQSTSSIMSFSSSLLVASNSELLGCTRAKRYGGMIGMDGRRAGEGVGWEEG